jgi:hypothetical protein
MQASMDQVRAKMFEEMRFPGISCVLMTAAQQFLRDQHGSKHGQRSER